MTRWKEEFSSPQPSEIQAGGALIVKGFDKARNREDRGECRHWKGELFRLRLTREFYGFYGRIR